MKHLNAKGQNTADIWDLNGLGLRCWPSREVFACLQHYIFNAFILTVGINAE